MFSITTRKILEGAGGLGRGFIRIGQGRHARPCGSLLSSFPCHGCYDTSVTVSALPLLLPCAAAALRLAQGVKALPIADQAALRLQQMDEQEAAAAEDAGGPPQPRRPGILCDRPTHWL
jgi:hypothetical protein